MGYTDENPKPRRVPMVPSPGKHPALQDRPSAITEIKDRNPVLLIGPIGHLAGAIAGVMAEVGTIQKGGYNAFHRYHYARMEDILQAITPLMGKKGIAVIQNEIEIKTVENRVAVTYEFSIIHESGEMWPERPRFTGMCNARNAKGDWDDKALNKCHTAARKYFLLSLFQVPAGDFDDADNGAKPEEATRESTSRERRPVPGPEKKEAASQQAQEGIPHKITLGPGAGADQWGNAYIRNIGKAKSAEDIEQFDKLNDSTLQMLSEQYPAVYDMLALAVKRRLADLDSEANQPVNFIAGQMPVMPNPREDAQVAMNWIAEQLQGIKTYEAAEAFWNRMVAPRETEFDAVDWGMLLEEWRRTETRLAPQEDDQPS